MRRILVLGATGNVGVPLVEELRSRGAPVRAAIRGEPEVVRDGVEYVTFDYFDPSTYGRAFREVEALYLLTPVVADSVSLVEKLVRAAKDFGVSKIVKQSAFGADRSEGVRLLKEHLLGEKIIEDSEIPYVFLRPTGFFQNYLGYAEDISDNGVFYLPTGEDRTAYIDARDVASVAARVLTEDWHLGKKYDLTGPESLSNEDIAAALSRATEDQIKFVPVSENQMRKGLREDGTPDWLADGLIELMRFCRQENAAKVLPSVKQLISRDARRFDDFARENAGRFKRRAVA